MTQRRSNSLMLPMPDDDDEIDELVPISDSSQLARAAAVADSFASAQAFQDYHDRISANTRRRQAAGLAAFATYLDAAGVPGYSAELLMASAEAWRAVSHGLVKGFARWMLQEGYAIATVNARLSTVRRYCALAFEADVLDEGQYSRIRLARGYTHKEGRNVDEEREKAGQTRKGHKKEAWVSLSKQQAIALKDQPDTPQGRRDALLMCLLLDHGLRCGEVAELQVTDFDLVQGTFTFYRRKVDKVQIHRMTGDTRRAAQAYFDDGGAPALGPLLRSSRKNGELLDGRMSPRAITGRVQALGAELGIENLSAHDCRHYWATAAANKTPIKALQDAGGWSSPAMPLRYVESAKIANEGVVLD